MPTTYESKAAVSIMKAIRGKALGETDTKGSGTSKTYSMPMKEAILEHVRLIAAIKSPSKTDDMEQLKEQGEELKEMEASVSKAEPTEAQCRAGNYKMEHMKLHGMDISIENMAGTTRRGTGPDGPWEVTMPYHYGYIKGTEGADGEHLDVAVGPIGEGSDEAHIINQYDPVSGEFDEHKVFIGFPTREAALEAFRRGRSDDPNDVLGPVVTVPIPELKRWIKTGCLKNQTVLKAMVEMEIFAKAEKRTKDHYRYVNGKVVYVHGYNKESHGEMAPAELHHRTIQGLSKSHGNYLRATDKEDAAAIQKKAAEIGVPVTHIAQRGSSNHHGLQGSFPHLHFKTAEDAAKVHAALIGGSDAEPEKNLPPHLEAMAKKMEASPDMMAKINPEPSSTVTDVTPAGYGPDAGPEESATKPPPKISMDLKEHPPIATFENKEDGTKTYVVKGKDGFHVAMQDTDSGEFLPSVTIYKNEADAIAAAESIVNGKPFAGPKDGDKKDGLTFHGGRWHNDQAEIKPLDHGALNIPGKSGNINAELDKYKAAEKKADALNHKIEAASNKETKAKAKALYVMYGLDMINKHGAKFDKKKLAEALDQMVKWEPKKFIALVEKFKAEQAAALDKPAPVVPWSPDPNKASDMHFLEKIKAKTDLIKYQIAEGTPLAAAIAAQKSGTSWGETVWAKIENDLADYYKKSEPTAKPTTQVSPLAGMTPLGAKPEPMDPYDMGKAAHAAGLGSAPALNKEFMDAHLKPGTKIGSQEAKQYSAAMDAYTNGWMDANLAAPVPESKPKVPANINGHTATEWNKMAEEAAAHAATTGTSQQADAFKLAEDYFILAANAHEIDGNTKAAEIAHHDAEFFKKKAKEFKSVPNPTPAAPAAPPAETPAKTDWSKHNLDEALKAAGDATMKGDYKTGVQHYKHAALIALHQGKTGLAQQYAQMAKDGMKLFAKAIPSVRLVRAGEVKW